MLKFRNKFFRRKKSSSLSSVNDGGGSDAENLSDFDSSVVEDTSDSDEEGPTLITVDDGKGGIKHVRVPRAPDRQIEATALPGPKSQEQMAEKKDEESGNNNNKTEKVQNGASASGSLQDALPQPKVGLGDMLKLEFKDKQNPFTIDPTVEKLRKRIVSKKGVVNISKGHLEKGQNKRFFTDFFNTMLDMRWRYVLTLFTLSFFLSWLAFACIWYLILYTHGDFEPEHLPGNSAGWTPCVHGIYNFTSCVLFSIETQHTIGYGTRQTSEECLPAVVTMCFQSVMGVMIQACMVGIIFAKLARPKKRAETLIFSKNAIVCLRDGTLYLCFRMANMRSSHLVECHTRAILVSKKVTEEGEVIPYHQTELTVGTDPEGEEDVIFFIWPATIVHKIDENSPFYNMSSRDFIKKRYEIIVVLEGIVEPTGMSIQARSSYLPNEILWGYNFANVLNYKWNEEVYKIDYTAFNKLYKCDQTPPCSAKAWADIQKGKRRDSPPEAGAKRSASTIVVPSSSPTSKALGGLNYSVSNSSNIPLTNPYRRKAVSSTGAADDLPAASLTSSSTLSSPVSMPRTPRCLLPTPVSPILEENRRKRLDFILNNP